MGKTLPSPELPGALGALTLPEANGDEVPLSSLWKDKPVILVHLRHFGCTFCRAHVEQLQDVQVEIEKRGATLAAIGTGNSYYARTFKEDRRIDFPVLVDKELLSYRSVGAKRSGFLRLLAPSVLAKGLWSILKRRRQGKTGNHPFQLGATHVIRPDGRVAFAWVNDDYADNAPIKEILAAL